MPRVLIVEDDGSEWMKAAVLTVMCVMIAAASSHAQRTKSKDAKDPLESARAAIEERLTTNQTMFKDVRVTAFRDSKTSTIRVTFRSVAVISPAENVRDVFGLIWQALAKAKAFKSVDRLNVASTGARPHAVSCPSKLVEESYGYMSAQRMNGGCRRE